MRGLLRRSEWRGCGARRKYGSSAALRDWERGRKDPDAAARAYLVVIGRNPTAVAEALDAAR
jgi:hypothetical protein